MAIRALGEFIPVGLSAGAGALLLSLLLTWWVMARVRRARLGQHVRDDGPQSHLAKEGTPSLGGVAILLAVSLATAAVAVADLEGAWTSWRSGLVLVVALLFGLLGFVDDWSKFRAGNTRGVPARYRIVLEFLLGFVFAMVLWALGGVPAPHVLGFGALWGGGVVLGGLAVGLGGFVVVGAGNAVNMTDGVDGLAGSTVAVCAGALGVIAAFQGAYDLAVPAWALAGGAAGFLWFNAHPARIFMGDVGSLGMGALLGALAVALGTEWLLALAGVVFVGEALSVIIQVAYFKRTGKRVFRMAPIHHAFELRGWSEPLVVARFTLVALVAGALAVMLYVLVGT